MRIAGAAFVALVAVVILFANVLRHPQYTPDGIVYARFAARDSGQSERDATLNARAFYEHTDMMSNPRYRDLIELDPSISFARSKVFENRILYPWIVGLLLPVAGFRALFIVSALSYVAFGLALYWLLRALGRPALAIGLTIVALIWPLTRDVASSDLTDMLAMVWWTLSLGALVRWLRDPKPDYLWLLAFTAALLTLTRPTPYLIVLPAISAAFLRRSWMPFLVSCSAVAAFLVTAVATHAYGITEQLRWVYTHRPNNDATPYGTWYRTALFQTLRATIVGSVKSIVPILALAAAVYGIARTQLRDEFIVLLVAGLACCIAIPFNPVPFALGRVVALPLIPVVCAIAQALAAVLVQPALMRSPSPRPAPGSAPVR
jgi:4-amino-4-deoxy-L-arabinose transferase-like glycosyltransferase